MISCSQSGPDIKSVLPSIVFEYFSEDAKPISRLSVFVESQSNVRRYDTMEVIHEKRNYIWEIDDPNQILLRGKMYLGNSNLKVPEGEQIPDGKYKIVCYEKDEDSTDSTFYLNYDKALYDLSVSEVPDFIKRKGGRHFISIFNSKNIMIYYGERTEELNTVRKVFGQYPEASYFYDIWKRGDDSVICVMPRTEVTPS